MDVWSRGEGKKSFCCLFLLKQVNFKRTRLEYDHRVTVCSRTFCICSDVLCTCTSSVCSKNYNCDISAAAHLRGSGEPVHKPADYLGAPRGLPSLPHKLLQLNTSYSLALSFLPRLLCRCYAFILHHHTPLAPSPLSHYSLVLFSLHLFCISLGFPSRWFPGIVPTWCFSPALAIHRFHKLWQKEAGRQAGKRQI